MEIPSPVVAAVATSPAADGRDRTVNQGQLDDGGFYTGTLDTIERLAFVAMMVFPERKN